MNCNTCFENTVVVDSRVQPDGTWRKRRCKSCGVVFNTYETLSDRQPLYKPRPTKSESGLNWRRAEPQPGSETPAADHTARNRIEDMKMQNEIDKLG